MRLADALLALDRAVTSADEAHALLTRDRQRWIAGGDSSLERFSRGQEVYHLSDGGNSAVTYSLENAWCALTRDSSMEARDNFENALRERREIERIIADWIDRRSRQRSSAA